MPLPFLVIAAAAAAAGLGVKKAVDAKDKNDRAQRINNSAQRKVEEAKKKIEISRKYANMSLEELGQQKIDIMSNDMRRFVSAYEKIHHVELRYSAGIEELSTMSDQPTSLAALKEASLVSSELAQGLAQGTLAGGLTAIGAYGGAMCFASASTGTAIATLSGAAATNATLAFFGGGSLAAGGLGIAGGTAVLGGLVAGPALAVLGFSMNAKAEKNLNDAFSNMAQANKIVEELAAASDMCDAIAKRATMFSNVLSELQPIFNHLIRNLEHIVARSYDYRCYTPSEQQIVCQSMAVAKAVKTMVDTPILTEQGELDEYSAVVGDKVNHFISNIIL